jgi:predicted phosphodiesterase
MAAREPKRPSRSRRIRKSDAPGTPANVSAELAVLSDIHSNLHALEAVLAECRRRKINRFLCLGDIVGYNAFPAECLRRIRALKHCQTVIGNHDLYVARGEVSEGLNTVAQAGVRYSIDHLTKSARSWLEKLPAVVVGESFTGVHATLEAPLEWDYIFSSADAAMTLHLQTTPVCFYGHTHQPKLFASGQAKKVEQLGESRFQLSSEGAYLVNPGSVGQPRGGDPRSQFVVFDSRDFSVEFVKVEYDIEAAGRRDHCRGPAVHTSPSVWNTASEPLRYFALRRCDSPVNGTKRTGNASRVETFPSASFVTI